MAEQVPDRSQDPNRVHPIGDTSHMIAKCGHEDPMGYFTGTVCLKCAKRNHKKAMGR